MTFADAIRAVERLEGVEVEVGIWGVDEGATTVAFLAGVLARMRSQVDLPPELEDAVEAVVLQIGPEPNNHVSLWPDRFVRAEATKHPEGVVVTTRDGVVRIERRSRPWID